jgi:hypothetical protein
VFEARVIIGNFNQIRNRSGLTDPVQAPGISSWFGLDGVVVLMPRDGTLTSRRIRRSSIINGQQLAVNRLSEECSLK